MFVDLPLISALFCSSSFCSSFLDLLFFTLLYSAFSLFTLSNSPSSHFSYPDDIIYKTFLVTVSIPQRICNGQPFLFAFCLFIYFQLTHKNVTVGAYFNIIVGSLFFLRRLANASQQYKSIKTFTLK